MGTLLLLLSLSLETLAYILVHSFDYVLELTAMIVLFLYRKRQPDRSRLFFSLFLMLSLAGSMLMMADVMVNGEDRRLQILEPLDVLNGIPIFFVLLLYLAECLRPYYLNMKRSLLLIAPWALVVTVTVVVCRYNCTPLYSWEDVYRNLDKPDVWMRICSLLMYFPYDIWVLMIRNNWQQSTVSRSYVRAMCVLTIVMTVTYIGGHGFQLMSFSVAHTALYITLTLTALAYEFLARPTLSPERVEKMSLESEEREAHTDAVQAEQTPVESAPVNHAVDDVRMRLEKTMCNPEVWQNPDLAMDDLVSLVGTNSNYLLQAIKQMGYKNYSDMLNHRRVQYIRERMDDDPDEPLQNIFYDAGYRSRTTAWRNFAAIVGMSPAEYRTKQ